MSKVKLYDYEFTFTGKESPEDFMENNIDYYTKLWLEENPEMAYKINDGDTADVYEDTDLSDVAENMVEVYAENLKNNYNF